jgi:hypothetical protein
MTPAGEALTVTFRSMVRGRLAASSGVGRHSTVGTMSATAGRPISRMDYLVRTGRIAVVRFLVNLAIRGTWLVRLGPDQKFLVWSP